MKKKRTVSLMLKTALLAAAFSLVMTGSALFIFHFIFSQNNEAQYKKVAETTAMTTSKIIDVEAFKDAKAQVAAILDGIENPVNSDEWGSPEWEAYSAKFDPVIESESYKKIFDTVTKIDISNPQDINCVALVYLDKRVNSFVYVVDSEAVVEERCPPGCLDIVLPQNEYIYTEPERGLPAYITNFPEYGWLVTSMAPIMEGNEVIGFALTDVSMEVVKQQERDIIFQMFLFMILVTILATAGNILAVRFGLINPLKKLHALTMSYKNRDSEENHQVFSNFKLKTNDELSELAASVVSLEEDVYNKMNELTSTSKKLEEAHHVAREMSEIAHKDALTGVKNKAAYDEWVQRVDMAIKEESDYYFAVAMIDLNNLKTINDEHGHSVGDISIKKLACTICETFIHSPVFRIGGDEFAVILEGHDYRNRDRLEQEFKNKIHRLSRDESLEFGERISAAIGVAVYHREHDKEYSDVFTRADHAMYECKRHMKEKSSANK